MPDDHSSGREGGGRQVGGREDGERQRGTDDPHRSRQRAVKILFQADLRGEAPMDALRRVVADPEECNLLDDLDRPGGTGEREGGLDRFARDLVEGVAENRDGIDETLGRLSRNWPVHRMPAIDRNVLRLGVYELTHTATSPAVVIDEAVELVKELSTEDSHRFVNGVLEAARKELAAASEDAPT